MFNWDVIEHEYNGTHYEFEADGKKWRLPHIQDLNVGQAIAAGQGRLELVFRDVAEVFDDKKNKYPLLTHTSNRPCAVGLHAPSVAYVGQIDKVEAGRMELAFADYVRALNIYGTKVLRATAVQTYLPAA